MTRRSRFDDGQVAAATVDELRRWGFAQLYRVTVTHKMAEDRREAPAELREEILSRCQHCGLREPDHAPDGKCLFEATYFTPITEV